MLPSTAHPERNRSKLSRSIVCFKMPSIGSLSSLGESNAVFLRGVGGDAATEPHKTGCSGYPEEEFSGTHMDLNASIFKPGETIRVEAHDGEGGRSTVRIGRVRLVGCGEPEPQEGDAMAGRGSRESCGPRRDPRLLPGFASESGSADTPRHPTRKPCHELSPGVIARPRILIFCGVWMSALFCSGGRRRERDDRRPLFGR